MRTNLKIIVCFVLSITLLLLLVNAGLYHNSSATEINISTVGGGVFTPRLSRADGCEDIPYCISTNYQFDTYESYVREAVENWYYMADDGYIDFVETTVYRDSVCDFDGYHGDLAAYAEHANKFGYTVVWCGDGVYTNNNTSYLESDDIPEDYFACEIYLNYDQIESPDSDTGVTLSASILRECVATHEIGHVLGLGHTQGNTSNIMNYPLSNARTKVPSLSEKMLLLHYITAGQIMTDINEVMAMKKILCVFTAICLVSLILMSCSSESVSCFDDIKIVQTLGHEKMDMSDAIADTSTDEAIIELSTQIVMGEIISREKVTMNDVGELWYIFEFRVDKIYHDSDSVLQEGDIIRLSTHDGIISAKEAKEEFGNSSRAKKYGYFQGEYAEDEYFASSMWNGIPMEVDGTYIVYLTNFYFERENLYADVGNQYTRRIEGDSVYAFKDGIKQKGNVKTAEKLVEKQLKTRTGRVDEVGRKKFIAELGKRQREATENP